MHVGLGSVIFLFLIRVDLIVIVVDLSVRELLHPGTGSTLFFINKGSSDSLSRIIMSMKRQDQKHIKKHNLDQQNPQYSAKVCSKESLKFMSSGCANGGKRRYIPIPIIEFDRVLAQVQVQELPFINSVPQVLFSNVLR